MNEREPWPEDPYFADDELDLREIGALAAVIYFAQALNSFGVLEPEATRIAQSIFQKGDDK